MPDFHSLQESVISRVLERDLLPGTDLGGVVVSLPPTVVTLRIEFPDGTVRDILLEAPAHTFPLMPVEGAGAPSPAGPSVTPAVQDVPQTLSLGQPPAEPLPSKATSGKPACKSCRKARKKCEGGPPCARCRDNVLSCEPHSK